MTKKETTSERFRRKIAKAVKESTSKKSPEERMKKKSWKYYPNYDCYDYDSEKKFEGETICMLSDALQAVKDARQQTAKDFFRKLEKWLLENHFRNDGLLCSCSNVDEFIEAFKKFLGAREK